MIKQQAVTDATENKLEFRDYSESEMEYKKLFEIIHAKYKKLM